LTQRYVTDPTDPDMSPKLSDVFLPGSILGSFRTRRIMYSEMALRVDSRISRNGVATGFLVEAYGGLAEGVVRDKSQFFRTGAQAAAFLPFGHRSTILSPKIAIDGLVPIDNGEIPFEEFPRQPTFRGFDNRRDYVSAVASLDYRWYLMNFLAARLFLDVARVYPSLSDVSFDHLRWATGLGFDFHTSSTELGRIAVAGSLEGFHLLFTLGVPAGFGDRQHRD
jgi:hypothetical protein